MGIGEDEAYTLYNREGVYIFYYGERGDFSYHVPGEEKFCVYVPAQDGSTISKCLVSIYTIGGRLCRFRIIVTGIVIFLPIANIRPQCKIAKKYFISSKYGQN